MDNISYITRQLQSMYPGDCPAETDRLILETARLEANERFAYLVSKIGLLNRSGSEPDPWHIMKHAIYLYILARVLYERNLEDPFRVKDRLYCLNKALHGCSVFYKVKLPAVFFLNYATGIVLGAACSYGENFVVSHGVTVGASRDKVPIIGNNVLLMPNSIVSGLTKLGNNVVVSAGVAVINQNVPDNTLVFSGPGGSNKLVFRPLENSYFEDYIQGK